MPRKLREALPPVSHARRAEWAAQSEPQRVQVDLSHLVLPTVLPDGVDPVEAAEMMSAALVPAPKGKPLAQLEGRAWLVEKGIFRRSEVFPGQPDEPEPGLELEPEGADDEEADAFHTAFGGEIDVKGLPAPSRMKSLEAESAMVHGAMAHPELLGQLRELAPPDELAGVAQRTLLKVLVALVDEGRELEPMLLRSRVAADKFARDSGALELVERLDNRIPPSEAITMEFARTVHQLYLERQELIDRRELAELAKSRSAQNGVFLERASQILEGIAARESRGWEAPVLEGTLPAVPFPMKVLPGPMADLAAEVAELTCCPAELFLLPCLTFVGALIGNSLSLRLKSQWVERPVLWTAYVMEKGNGKTAALEQALCPLFDIFKELRADHKFEVAMRKDLRLKATKSDKPAAERAALLERLEEPVTMRRFLVNDTTWEGLAKTMSRNPRGLAMYQDELSGWLLGMNQYKSHGNDLEHWLSSWSGMPIVIDRKGQDDEIPVVVPRPLVGVSGGIQPGKLTLLRHSIDIGDGLFDRMLVSWPSSVRQEWTEESQAVSGSADYARVIRTLWDRECPTDGAGEPNPAIVNFTAAAKERWVEWFNAICQEFDQPDFPEHLRGAWSKHRIYCARLSLILDVLRVAFRKRWNGQPRDVELVSLEGAIELIGYFQTHFRRVSNGIKGEKESNAAAVAVLKWAVGSGRRKFNEKQARDNFRRSFSGDPSAIGLGLDWLLERHCLRLRDGLPAPSGRGRPGSRSFEVNPALFKKGALRPLYSEVVGT